MRFGKYLVAALASAALLAGCGGGGDPAPPNDPSASAGVWSGTTTSGRQLNALLLSDGTYWFIYSAAGDSTTIAGAGQGTATSAGGFFASTDGVDFNLEGAGFSPFTANGTYTPGRVLSGAIHYPTSTLNFITTFVDAPPPHLDNISGSYIGQAATFAGVEDIHFDISVSGAISGTDSSGCAFTGAAAARTDIAAFDITVTFGGGFCALGTSTVAGVSYFDPIGGVLYSTALNSSRTSGFLAIAGKI